MSAYARTDEHLHTTAATRTRRDAKALAREHRDAIRRRGRRIRRSIATVAVTLFAAAFLVLYVQLASGHDPALVANAEKRAVSTSVSRQSSSPAATSSSSTETSSASEASSATETSEASESTASSSETSSGPSAVSTSQS